MNREIKFRGLCINGKDWHEGNLSILKQNIRSGAVKAGSYISNSVGLPFAYEVRPETVGQYTGLKDKNGKDIYEEDIAKAVFYPEVNRYLNSPKPQTITVLIKWGTSGWIVKNLTKGKASRAWERKSIGQVEILEIIGNSCENPELIK